MRGTDLVALLTGWFVMAGLVLAVIVLASAPLLFVLVAILVVLVLILRRLST